MMQDILHDSPIYQMIMQEGREEEHSKMLQKQRLTILRIVQAKFPKLARLAIDQTNKITNLDRLEDLTVNISIAQTEEETNQLLSNKEVQGDA